MKTLALSENIHTQLRRIAAEEKMKIQDVTEQAVNSYIDNYYTVKAMKKMEEWRDKVSEFNSEKPNDNKDFFNNLIFGKENFEVKVV